MAGKGWDRKFHQFPQLVRSINREIQHPGKPKEAAHEVPVGLLAPCRKAPVGLLVTRYREYLVRMTYLM